MTSTSGISRQPPYFSFFVISEPETAHLRSLANGLSMDFSLGASPALYGEGVKSIVISLVATNPEGFGRNHKVKPPRFLAGVRTIKAHGLMATIEDALELELRPDYASVVNAKSSADLAAAIAACLIDARPSLRKLSIPGFANEEFLTDLEGFLRASGVTRTRAQPGSGVA